MKENSKNWFMSELRNSLEGNLPADKINDIMNYYDNYFLNEKNNGKSEEEICKSLGSPRLIAKSMITSEIDANGKQYYTENSNTNRNTNRNANRNGNQNYGANEYGGNPKGWHVNVNDAGTPSLAFGKLDFGTPFGKIVGLFIIVVIALVIISLFFVGLPILVSIVLPVALIILIVKIIISLFRE